MKVSKKQLILDYLRKYGSITPDEARLFCRKCERLAARISELRADGYNIVTDKKPLTACPSTMQFTDWRINYEQR